MHARYSFILETMSAFGCLGMNILMHHRQDLTKTQLEVMLTLRYGGSLSMTELSRYIAVSNEQTSRATAPLVHRGFVNKRRSDREHRVIRIQLTEAGQSFMDDLEREFLKDVSRGFNCLSEEELEKLSDASKTASSLVWRALRGQWM